MSAMSFTRVLGLIFVIAFVSAANRTKQEVNNGVNRNPLLCSSLPTLKLEPNELVGDWVIRQTLQFDQGMLPPENDINDEPCFNVCWKFNVKLQDNKLAVKSSTFAKSQNFTHEETINIVPKKVPGRFDISGDGGELVIISGNPKTHLIIGTCNPMLTSSGGQEIQVLLHTYALISRAGGRKGQNVFTIQELEAQVEMLKVAGLSKVQWPIIYNSLC